MKILQIGDPILEQKTKYVEDIKDDKIQKLISSMVDFVLKDEGSAGLAAPQIGKDLSLCVVKRVMNKEMDGEQQKVTQVIPLINPSILSQSESTSIFWEGCLSVGVGEDRLFGPVERSKRVKIEYIDREGNKKILKADGFFSHVVQHELDHLNGVLFLKYVNDPDNVWRSKDLDEYIEKHGAFPSVVGVEEKVSELVGD